MAPEIANGRYGREIDTYALGIILFEMLTGHVPFEGESVGEVLMKHLTAEPDLTALAEPYRGIVERALAKDPALRIKSVGELVELLPGDDPAQRAPRVARPEIPFEPQVVKPAWPGSRDAASKAAVAFEAVKQNGRWNKQSGEKLEEPIWKAIRETFSSESLHKAHPLKRAVALFAVVVLCVMYADKAMALAMPLLLCYVVYYIVWSSIAKKSGAGNAENRNVRVSSPHDLAHVGLVPADEKYTVAWPNPEATEAAIRQMGVTRSPLRTVRSTWRERAKLQLIAKSWREKVSELLASMLLSALIASLVALAAVAVLSLREQPPSEQMAAYLWLAAVGTLGSWAVLVPSKFFEGKLEDHAPIRISLLLLGTFVGVAAWWLGDVLMLKMPGWHHPVDLGSGIITQKMLGWPESTDGGNAPLAIYVAYFAFLFLVPRWWKQTEYTRSSRLSLWTAFTCAGWAWLLHMFWWFPQPLGVMVAGVMALSIQLTSPWMPPSKRKALSGAPEPDAE
jgi:hypothetical protein